MTNFNIFENFWHLQIAILGLSIILSILGYKLDSKGLNFVANIIGSIFWGLLLLWGGVKIITYFNII